MDIEDLRTTASLAHLNVDEAELEAALPAFREMLSYFAAMQAADGDEKAFGGGIAGLSFTGDSVASTHFRQDAPTASGFHPLPSAGKERPAYAALDTRSPEEIPEDLAGIMLDKAGERDGRFIVVPNVL